MHSQITLEASSCGPSPRDESGTGAMATTILPSINPPSPACEARRRSTSPKASPARTPSPSPSAAFATPKSPAGRIGEAVLAHLRPTLPPQTGDQESAAVPKRLERQQSTSLEPPMGLATKPAPVSILDTLRGQAESDDEEDDEDSQLLQMSRKRRKTKISSIRGEERFSPSYSQEPAATKKSHSHTHSRSSSSSSLTSLDLSDLEDTNHGREIIEISSNSDPEDPIDYTKMTLTQPRAKRSTAKQNSYDFGPKMYRSNRPLRPSPSMAAEKAKIVPDAERKIKSKFTIQSLLRDKQRRVKAGIDLKGIEALDAMAAADLDMHRQSSVQPGDPPGDDLARSMRDLENQYWEDTAQQSSDDEGQPSLPSRQSASTSRSAAMENPWHSTWQEPQSAATSTESTPDPQQRPSPHATSTEMVHALNSLGTDGAESKERDLVAEILKQDFGNKSDAHSSPADHDSRFELWRRGRVRYDCVSELTLNTSKKLRRSPCVEKMLELVRSREWARLESRLTALSLSDGVHSADDWSIIMPWALLLSIHAEGGASNTARQVLYSALAFTRHCDHRAESAALLVSLLADALITLGARRDLIKMRHKSSESSTTLRHEPMSYGPSIGSSSNLLDPKRRASIVRNLVRTVETVMDHVDSPTTAAELVRMLHLIACDDASFQPLERSDLQQVVEKGASLAFKTPAATLPNLISWIRDAQMTSRIQYKALACFPNSTPALRTMRRNIAFEILFNPAHNALRRTANLEVCVTSPLVSEAILPNLKLALWALQSPDAQINPLWVPKQGADFAQLGARIGILGVALSDFGLQLCDPEAVQATRQAGSQTNGEGPPRAASSWGQTVSYAFRSTVKAFAPAAKLDAEASASSIEPSRARVKTLSSILEALTAIQVRLSAIRATDANGQHSAGAAQSNNATIQKSQCISNLSRLTFGWQYVLHQMCGVRMVNGLQYIDDSNNGDEDEAAGIERLAARARARGISRTHSPEKRQTDMDITAQEEAIAPAPLAAPAAPAAHSPLKAKKVVIGPRSSDQMSLMHFWGKTKSTKE